MKVRILLACILFASAWPARAAISANPEELCATLQRAPWDPLALQMMQTLMRDERESVAIRSRAMALCTLALLRQGNTNQFVRATQILDTTYPDEKGLVTVTVAEQYKVCPRCKGTGKIQTVCAACMGTGQQFELAPSVQENYTRLLAEILAFCQENKRFEKASALAFAEPDNAKRIARLESLLSDFPKRTDLERAKKSLAEATKIRDAALAKKQEEEKREKEEREIERLRVLHQVPAENRPAAIAEIEAFLMKHPTCYARVELEEVKDALVSKVNFRNRLITSGYWLGGIFVLFIAMTALKSMLASRRVESLPSLPGMNRVDKSKFTDPLADERERTEARRHTQER